MVELFTLLDNDYPSLHYDPYNYLSLIRYDPYNYRGQLQCTVYNLSATFINNSAEVQLVMCYTVAYSYSVAIKVIL